MTPRSKTILAIVVSIVVAAAVATGIYFLVKSMQKKPSSVAKQPGAPQATPVREEKPANVVLADVKPANLAKPALEVMPSPITDMTSPDVPGATIHTLNTGPFMQSIEGFMTDAQCDELIALAEPRFTRSSVVDMSTGENVPDASRTSYSVYFIKGETPLIKQIEARAAKLVGVPVSHLEPLQVVRYTNGQFYKAHHDYLPRSPDVIRYGNRTATVFAYLNTLPPEEMGGGTFFPMLQHSFRPRKGTAALWHNMLALGKVDDRTLHSGEPLVLDTSVKYGLNVWIREREYP